MELCFHKMLKKCYRFFFPLKCMYAIAISMGGKFMFSVSIENASLLASFQVESGEIFCAEVFHFFSSFIDTEEINFPFFHFLSQSCVAVNLNLSTIRRLWTLCMYVSVCVKWRRIFLRKNGKNFSFKFEHA